MRRLGGSPTSAARCPAPGECHGNEDEKGKAKPQRANPTRNCRFAVEKHSQHMVEVMIGLGGIRRSRSQNAPSDPMQKFRFLCLELRLGEHVDVAKLAQLAQLVERISATLGGGCQSGRR